MVGLLQMRFSDEDVGCGGSAQLAEPYGLTRQAAALRSVAFCVCEGPVEPGHQRFEVGGLDGRAAPDAQAGRRVAIGADVVGDAFLVEQRRPCPWRRPPGRRRRARRRPGRRCDRQTEVFERVAGSTARWPSQGDLLRRSRSMTAALASARAISASRPPIDFAQLQRVEIVLDAQHRRRVDRLALEDAFDQLAARGQAEDLRQRPGRLVALQPLDGARRQDQHAVRALAAQHLLPGEGDDIELVRNRASARRRPRSRRRWSGPRGRPG